MALTVGAPSLTSLTVLSLSMHPAFALLCRVSHSCLLTGQQSIVHADPHASSSLPNRKFHDDLLECRNHSTAQHSRRRSAAARRFMRRCAHSRQLSMNVLTDRFCFCFLAIAHVCSVAADDVSLTFSSGEFFSHILSRFLQQHLADQQRALATRMRQSSGGRVDLDRLDERATQAAAKLAAEEARQAERRQRPTRKDARAAKRARGAGAAAAAPSATATPAAASNGKKNR